MKTYINRFFSKACLVALGSLTIMGCDDEEFLNQEPNDSVIFDQAITNETQLGIAINGIYNRMQSYSAFGNLAITSQALIGDNGFVSTDNSNRFTDFNNYTFADVDNGNVDSYWTALYGVIGRANFVLDKEGSIADDITTENSNPNDYFAQAYIARAISYFYLVNTYANSYGQENQDLGVPIVFDFDPTQKLGRASVPEVYAQIESDLQTALSLLEGKNFSSKTYFGTDAANLLMSRVKLYKGDYNGTVEYADRVINSGFSSYSVQEELFDFYLTDESSESVWELLFTPNDNLGSNDALLATWSLDGTYAQNFATQEFYDLINDSDVRKSLYVPVTGYPDNPLPVDVRKYLSLDTNLSYLRKSEAAFNKIEALYYINEDQAKDELQAFVSNYRISDYDVENYGDLLEEIRKQRRIEFAFEGQRWFDLNRWNLPIIKGANCTQNCVIDVNDYRRVFPIPLWEMQNNPNIVQNPGY